MPDDENRDDNLVNFPKKKKPRPIGLSDEEAAARSRAMGEALIDLTKKKGLGIDDPMANLFTGDEDG